MMFPRPGQLFLVLSAVFALASAEASGQWRRAGLAGELVTAIAVDPSNDQTLYASSFQALWKSTNGGAAWARSQAGYTGDAAVGIVINASSSSTVVVASNSGVHRSTNGGASWSESNGVLASRQSVTLGANPSRPTDLWISVNSAGGGVYRSTDFGASWSALPIPVPSGAASSFAFHGDDVYAAWANVTFLTHNGGAWSIPVPDGFGDSMTALVRSPEDDQLLAGLSAQGVYRTTAAPPVWRQARAGLVSRRMSALLPRPGDVHTVFAASSGGGVFRSSDGGRGWTAFSSGLENTDIAALATDAAGDHLYAATADGVFVYDLSASAPCGDVTALCLNASRFKVDVNWRVLASGQSGKGTPIPIVDDTGTFWFFTPTNLELMIKVLDGRGVNGKFWVFFGALSNVEYTVTVTDTATGAVRTYLNPSGTLASVADTSAF